MALKTYKATTPSRRFRADVQTEYVAPKSKMRGLVSLNKKSSGRNTSGKISVRHRGGRSKRFLRKIDFKRDKVGVVGYIRTLEYDPNRSANIVLVSYRDGDKRYILAPAGAKIGDKVVAGSGIDTQVGNAMKLAEIPVGTPVHNIELRPGGGAKIVRSAGNSATILSKDEKQVIVRLPSTEVRIFAPNCMATIGQVGNVEHGSEVVGKAGRNRLRGVRPTVRGSAMDPGSHPHGGGEGRTGVGMKAPKSKWGKRVMGVRTRKKKQSSKLIVSRRKK
jgi:large subunit ribosomal protein L2